MAKAAVGCVMVKFLLTVQNGLFVNVAVIVYVPAAKVLMVIGPAVAAVPAVTELPRASTIV